MKAFLTNLPIFTGFYGSIWSEPDFEGEAEHFEVNEDFDFYDFVDYHKYEEALSEDFCSIVADDLSDYVESIKYHSLWSPQYYNFQNDKIKCEIVPKIQVIKRYIYEHLEDFEKCLRENFKSRDGFMSFHPYDFESWRQRTKFFTDYSEYEFFLGTVLNFIADMEKIDDESLYYTGVHIGEFYTPELYEAIEEYKYADVRAWVKENYMIFDLEAKALKHFEDKEPADVIKAVNEQVKEIESHTLEIPFPD